MSAVTNANLHTVDHEHVTKFKFLQYNVDQAMREEKFEATKWSNRHPRVQKLINEVNADIVCLQEMRKLPGTITVNQFLAQFEQYYYELGYRNPSILAFGQATLYNPNKFYCMQTVKRWLSDTPNLVSDTWAVNAAGTCGFGYIVLGTQFVPVKDGKVVLNAKPFWVFNVHLGMEEDVKTKSCTKLLELCPSIAQGQEFIIAEDWNFFPDRDGHKQRAIMVTKFKDLGAGAKTLGGKLVEGTFVGYEHDEFKADLKNMVSRLDNVFGTAGVIASDQTLYTKTMLPEEPEELTCRNTPSDHLPLVMTININ